MKSIPFALLLTLLVGCSHKPAEVPKVETKNVETRIANLEKQVADLEKKTEDARKLGVSTVDGYRMMVDSIVRVQNDVIEMGKTVNRLDAESLREETQKSSSK